MFCTAMLSVCAVKATSSTSYSKQNVCKIKNTLHCKKYYINLYVQVYKSLHVDVLYS